MNVIEVLAKLRDEVARHARKIDELRELAIAAEAAQIAAENSGQDPEQSRRETDRTLTEIRLGLMGTACDLSENLMAITKAVVRELQEVIRSASEFTPIGRSEESPPKPTIRARILVADDLEMIQKLTRSFLETAGHEVDVVSDGDQAVAAVQAASYDLIVMDIQMPVMDGITATRKIRALDPPACNVPIIAMTTNVLPHQVRSYEEAGMNGCIGKPIKRNAFLKKLREWLPETDRARVADPVSSARILVVDDLDIIQKLARTILESAGYMVDFVCDGDEAVAAVQEKTYGLVLMDIEMPEMDGMTATRAIRALESPARNVPIIAMTVHVSPQQVRSYEEVGMNDHISKPLNREVLLKKIHDLLPSEVPPRPFFDIQGLDEFRKLMGSDQAAFWLAKFNDQLKTAFTGEYSVPSDREQLARDAHTLVSHAGVLGFAELSHLCRELEEASSSGQDLSIPLDKARKASDATRELIGKWMAGAKSEIMSETASQR